MPVTGQSLPIIVNGASTSGFWKSLWLTARRYCINNEWTDVFPCYTIWTVGLMFYHVKQKPLVFFTIYLLIHQQILNTLLVEMTLFCSKHILKECSETKSWIDIRILLSVLSYTMIIQTKHNTTRKVGKISDQPCTFIIFQPYSKYAKLFVWDCCIHSICMRL